MFVRNIFLSILAINVAMFCGCASFSPATEPLPDQKEIHTSRDYTYHERVSSLPTVPTKSLDPDFIGRYTDENAFREGAEEVKENMETTKEGAAGVEEEYKSAVSEINNAERDQEHYSDLLIAIQELEKKMGDMIKDKTEEGQKVLGFK